MTQAKPQSPQMFWWLVSGEVFFHPVGKPDEIQATMVNCNLTTIAPVVNGEALGQAQRGLMQTIIDRTADSGVQMVPAQVTIIAVSGLGLMSKEEFLGDLVVAAPEDPSPAKVS